MRIFPGFSGLLKYSYTVHDLKLSHFKKKLQKSVTIWEHLPKSYHFWTIIKQKMGKSVTIWKKCDYLRSWTVLYNTHALIDTICREKKRIN